MKKVKIVQIGIGHDHATLIFNSLKKQSDIFEIVGYYIPDSEVTDYFNKLSCFDGFKMLTIGEIMNNPEIEAVAIETEEKYLTKYALMAAEHNKKIHMDKPGGMELEDFKKLIRIVKQNNLVFHLGYMYRYNPEVQKLLEDIKKGELGEIYAVETHMSVRYDCAKRQWLSNFPGGMMFFLGCHLIDIILQIQGEPENVISLNKCTGYDNVTALDYGMVVFEYKNGISFAKTCSKEIGGMQRRQIVVCGTKKTVEIKPTEIYSSPSMIHTDVSDYDLSKGYSKRSSEQFDRYDNMMAAFAKMTNGVLENPWNYDYELMLYKYVLKACGK